MNAPTIVNIHKVKGVRPAFDIYIGRAVFHTEFTTSSKWHNPFPVKMFGDDTLPMYEAYIHMLLDNKGLELSNPNFHKIMVAVRRSRTQFGGYNIDDLTGKVLGCWCKPGPCHGDVLIKLWKEKHDAENRY